MLICGTDILIPRGEAASIEVDVSTITGDEVEGAMNFIAEIPGGDFKKEITGGALDFTESETAAIPVGSYFYNITVDGVMVLYHGHFTILE